MYLTTTPPTSLSLSSLLLILVAAAICIQQINNYIHRRKIISLGGYAREPSFGPPIGRGFYFIWRCLRAVATHSLLELNEECIASAENHTVEVPLGTQRVIWTSDAENIKAILSTQFDDFGKGERFLRTWRDFIGASIFSTDGVRWKHSRALIRPQFMKDRFSDLETFERHVLVLLEKLDKNEQVDPTDLFLRFTLDAATDFLLGQSVNSLDERESSFADAFAGIQAIQLKLVILSASPLQSLYPRRMYDKYLATLNAFVDRYVNAALAIDSKQLQKMAENDQKYDFLHALAAGNRDPAFLRNQIVATLLAGRDTTATTLAWLFYELGRQPAVVSKLRQEILEVVGPTAKPTFDQLKSMKYLQNTLSETLRLYPSVPRNERTALVDTTLPRGGGPDGLSPIGILQGTPVQYTVHGLHLQPEHYAGSDIDPLHFEPDRWLTWHPKPWTYLPFNGGPRICVGQQWALMEMSYSVVRILQKFQRLELDSTSLIAPRGSPGEKLFFKNGKESFAWRASREHLLGMKTDIILTPATSYKMKFIRA